MTALLAVVYAVYFIGVGIEGNAPALMAMIGNEGQFLYWVVVLMVCLALWESNVGEELAKPLVLLILVGFLLHKVNGTPNYQTIGANAKAILPAL